MKDDRNSILNKALPFFLLLFSTIIWEQGNAQSELTSFTVTGRGGVATTFVTDYQAIGINPANLGWDNRFEDKKIALGLSEGSYSVFAEALRKQELRDELMNFDSRDFTFEEKKEAARKFAEKGFGINMDFMAIGAAYSSSDFGGVAFNIRDRGRTYFNLSPTATDILFKGYNADYFNIKLDAQGDTTMNPDSVEYGTVSDSLQKSIQEITEGSEANISWYREFNLSYGRKIIKTEDLSLYAGAGIKYIRGFVLMDLRSKDGELTAYSATSPAFDIDYGSAARTNPSADTTNSGTLPDAVGKGFGFDLGANVVIGEKLKVGAAVNNIGSITWTGNVYQAKDTIVYDTESNGVDSYNFLKDMDELVGDSGVFQWSGDEKRVVQLPTVLRFGASYELSDKIEIGGDLVLPMNDAPGSYQQPIAGIGGAISPIKWLELSAGVKTNPYGDVVNVPVGLVLRSPTGGYEAGIASRDAVTFFTQNTPTLSLSTGFLRFRF